MVSTAARPSRRSPVLRMIVPVAVALAAVVAAEAGCSSSSGPAQPATTTIGGPPGSVGSTTCADLTALSSADPDRDPAGALVAVRRARASVPPAQQAALDTLAAALDQISAIDPADPDRPAKALGQLQTPDVLEAFQIVDEFRDTVCGPRSPASTAPDPGTP